MSDPFAGQPEQSKAARLATAINRLLFELTIRCTKDMTEGVRNYYEVGVIGYGATVGPALGGLLSGRHLVTIREIADNPAKVNPRTRKIEDGAGGLVEEKIVLPEWFEPIADNGTPMCEALSEVLSILSPWVSSHPNSSPPIVINITDGEPNPGCNPRTYAEKLQNLATSDGNVLLFNLHISSDPATPIFYPESPSVLPDASAKQLFEMSSNLPPHIYQAAQGEGYNVSPNSRGFVFNADIVEVIKFLDIGTRARGLR